MQKLLQHQFPPPGDERTSAHLVRLRGVIHGFLAQRQAPALLHPVTLVQLDPVPAALDDATLDRVARNPALLDHSSNDDDEGDDEDDDDDADGDDAGREDREEQQSSSPPVLQLDYELGGLLSSKDPIARLLCDYRHEYNAATIRLHALEVCTPYPAAAAASELHQLRALLERVQQARPPSVHASLAMVHVTETLAFEIRKLKELVNDQIGELNDRLEALDKPSSRTEVAATFDLSLRAGIDDEVHMAHQHAGSTTDTQLPRVETTPHKEDCVHRGILFQCKVLAKLLAVRLTYLVQTGIDACEKSHMLCLLALSAFLLRDAGDDVLTAASTCLPTTGLLLPRDIGLGDVAAIFTALEDCLHSLPVPLADSVLAASYTGPPYHYRYLRSTSRITVCCQELASKIAPVALLRLRTRLASCTSLDLLEKELHATKEHLGIRLTSTAPYVAECADFFRRFLEARFTRLCCHSRNAEDVKFATEHYAHNEIRTGSAPVDGIVLHDANGSAYAIKSVQCTGFVEAQRGKNTTCCKQCRAVTKKVQNARHGKERFHSASSPRLKRKLSFADYGHVKSLQNTNSALRRKIRQLSDQLEAALDCAGAPAYGGSDECGKPMVTLRACEEHDLVTLLLKVVKNGQLPRDSWLYRDIYHNVMAASKRDLRGLRYSPEQIAYWQNMRFLGGSRMIDQLRGPINEGTGNKGGHLPNDASRVRRYVPTNSTLNAHSAPLELYPELAADAEALSRALAIKKTAAVGGISFDAISISRGYTYAEHVALLVGAKSSANRGPGAIRLSDIEKYTLDQLRDMVGSHVLQLFWTSLDGRASVPIGYIVTQGDDPGEIASAVSTAIDALSKHGIQTVFTSSDGFIGCADFVRRMHEWAASHPTRPKDLPFVHVFDYVHVLKCLRNRLLNQGFALADGTIISMKDLARIWLDAANAPTRVGRMASPQARPLQSAQGGRRGAIR